MQFNTIPGSGLIAPITTFEFNSGGQYAPGTRIVLIGHKTAVGTQAFGSVQRVSTQSDADIAAGPGSMLREMFRAIRENAPVQDVWLAPVQDIGTAPTWTLTITAPPALPGVGGLVVCGANVLFSVAATDTAAMIATNLAAAINTYFNPLTKAMLPVTATVAGAVVTVTSRHAGAIMNDINFATPPAAAILAAVLTIAPVAAGAGVPLLSAAFAALGDSPGDFILHPWSDITSLSTGSAALNDTAGRWAWSRQSYGHVWTTATGPIAALTTVGLAQNDRHLSIIARPPSAPHPSWLWVSAMAACVAPWLSDITLGNVSRNQTGLVVNGLAAPLAGGDVPGYATRNVLLGSGISTWALNGAGQVCIDKIITTYQTGLSGQPDTTFRDVQKMYQLSGGFGFIRAAIQTEQGNKALALTNPGNLGSVTTPSDIKASAIHAYSAMELRGVFTNSAYFAANVQCQINASNPDRADLFMPINPLAPLDIIAANATVYQAFPA